MKLTPFWTDQSPRPDDLPLSDLPGEVDVAVIGSGVTGLNAAIEIVKANIKVVVLEKETIGWGASSRNAGMMSAGMKASTDYLLRKYGAETTKLFFHWSADAVDYVDKVIQDENIECDYVRNGAVFLACKPSQFEGLRGYKEELERDYEFFNTRLLGPEELQTEIGSSIYAGGLVNDFSAGLDPAKYTYGLARAASNYGADLVENSEVLKIRDLDGSFELSTTKGVVQTQQVLMATNGYTTNLVPKIRRGIFPSGSYIAVTEPLPPHVQDELAPNRRNFEDVRAFLNYFCLTADGRALIGGRRSLSTNLDLHVSAEHLYKRLLEIWPQVEGYKVTHVWTGKLGISFDLMPHAGQLEGVWFANGYCGHGLAIGSYLGHEIGRVIAGKLKSSPMMETNHPRYFFSRLDKLFIPPVSLYYKIMDWMN
jgi:glycine/D-amino acid oxidase-like deaminating enzyme